MNRRWLITIGIIALVLIVVGVLHENGMLNFKWTGLSMVLAAIAGPYHMLKKWLVKDKRMETLMDKQKVRVSHEQDHRAKYDKAIEQREQRIKELNEEIKEAEKRIQNIEKKKTKTKSEVEDMSIKELQDEGIDMFGA